MAIYQLGDDIPSIPDSAFIANEATLIGQVVLAERTSVWFGAVLRADNEPIRIGHDSNIQEGCELHTDPGFPLDVGNNCTIGHQAMLHGCTIGDGSLIGIQAVVLNGAVIGKDCLVGAGSIVTEGKTFPDRSLVLGVPAKRVRELTDEEVERLAKSAADYSRRRERYKLTLKRIGPEEST
jgi:carbonic anhydrase/acetyltransferase-like protein (isoleucine patch superfamily)